MARTLKSKFPVYEDDTVIYAPDMILTQSKKEYDPEGDENTIVVYDGGDVESWIDHSQL